MYKIIALIGKAGSGKDTLMKEILKQNSSLHEIISYTTRPKREGEQEGINYFYVDEKTFMDTDMFEHTKFNNWYYGTGHKSLSEEKINIGVFNPAGIRFLIKHPEVKVSVYRVHASNKTRLLRQLNREVNPNVDEIIRRYSADEIDFNNLDFTYHSIPNETYDDLLHGAIEILSLEGQDSLIT